MNANSHAQYATDLINELNTEIISATKDQVFTIDLDAVQSYTNDPNLGFDPQVGGKLKEATPWGSLV